MMKAWVSFPIRAPDLAQHPLGLSSGREPALTLNQITKEATKLPPHLTEVPFSPNPLPSAVSARPAELR